MTVCLWATSGNIKTNAGCFCHLMAYLYMNIKGKRNIASISHLRNCCMQVYGPFSLVYMCQVFPFYKSCRLEVNSDPTFFILFFFQGSEHSGSTSPVSTSQDMPSTSSNHRNEESLRHRHASHTSTNTMHDYFSYNRQQ